MYLLGKWAAKGLEKTLLASLLVEDGAFDFLICCSPTVGQAVEMLTFNRDTCSDIGHSHCDVASFPSWADLSHYFSNGEHVDQVLSCRLFFPSPVNGKSHCSWTLEQISRIFFSGRLLFFLCGAAINSVVCTWILFQKMPYDISFVDLLTNTSHATCLYDSG